jgi:hypothetical protein
MTASIDPKFITVTLPVRPWMPADPEAEKRLAQGLIGALRENYPATPSVA